MSSLSKRVERDDIRDEQREKRKAAFDADVAKIREEMQQEERDAELREVLVGTASVELIRENADGSADYMFNFPPEAMAALTRLGIMTAIQAGVDGAKRYDPDEEEPPAPVMDESIKCLAIEAGFIAWDEEEWRPAGVVSLIKFYHLVRKEAIAQEREACATTCEYNQASWTEAQWNDACARCAEAIRVRAAQ